MIIESNLIISFNWLKHLAQVFQQLEANQNQRNPWLVGVIPLVLVFRQPFKNRCKSWQRLLSYSPGSAIPYWTTGGWFSDFHSSFLLLKLGGNQTFPTWFIKRTSVLPLSDAAVFFCNVKNGSDEITTWLRSLLNMRYLVILCLCLTDSICFLMRAGCTWAASFNTIRTASYEKREQNSHKEIVIDVNKSMNTTSSMTH